MPSLSREEVARFLGDLGITLELSPTTVDTLAEVSVEEVMADAAQHFLGETLSTEPTFQQFGETTLTTDEMNYFLEEVARFTFESGETTHNRKLEVVPVTFDLEAEFDGSLELAKLFLISGLEAILTQQATDEETLLENLQTLESLRDTLPLRNDLLATQHVRRVLAHSKNIARKFVPGSSLPKETYEVLQTLSDSALDAPALHLALIANGESSVHGVLPLLPAKIDSMPNIGSNIILNQAEHYELTQALEQDHSLAMGLALTLLSNESVAAVLSTVNRVWGGTLNPEDAEILATFLKDDTAG